MCTGFRRRTFELHDLLRRRLKIMAAESTKSKIKPGTIELDPVESVVIVNFEKQTLDMTGPEPVVIDRQPGNKRYCIITRS